MKAEIDNALKQRPSLPAALRLVWTAEAVWAVLRLGLILLQTLLPVAKIYLITHRFKRALRADQIYVMGDSRIIEENSHDEFLCMKRSAASWHLQTNKGGGLADTPEPS